MQVIIAKHSESDTDNTNQKHNEVVCFENKSLIPEAAFVTSVYFLKSGSDRSLCPII